MAKQKENLFRRAPWLLHLLLMLGVSVAILFLTFLFIRLYARQGEEYELADLEGTRLAEAMADNPVGIDYIVLDSIYRPRVEGGIILTQDPKAGTHIKQGRKVYITVTAFQPEAAAMPELSGLTVRQAVSELLANGLNVGKLKYVADPYKNTIVDQSCKGRTVYAGQEIASGSVIDLVVGLGDSTGASVVPFVIGKTADRARRDILCASLNVGREHYNGVKDRATAVVYRQEPDYTGVSKYPYGTEVKLWYIDADDDEIEKMVSSFRVDSSKIIDPNTIDDGRPTPDQLDDIEDMGW